jgi:spore coat protein SA
LRVAIVAPESAPIPPIKGGAVQTGIWEIAPLLARDVHELLVVSPKDPALAGNEFCDGIQHLRVNSGRWPGWKKFWRFDRQACYAEATARFLRTWQPDIVHVRNRPLAVFPLRAALGSNAKIILHFHNEPRERQMQVLLPHLPHYDAYVAISRFLLECQVREYGLPADRAWVIHNGVNIERFRPITEQTELRQRMRARLGIDEAELVVLFAGRFNPKKGIQHLVDAMDIVQQEIASAVFLLAGAPVFGTGRSAKAADFARRMLAGLERLPGKVVNLGMIPPAQMPEVFAVADLFAGPSVWEEPFGLAFLEAQASGLPVLASRRGGIPEVVVDQQTGILLDDPTDHKTMANQIIALLKNPDHRSALGSNGRARAKGFTWEKTAQETLRLYRSLLA